MKPSTSILIFLYIWFVGFAGIYAAKEDMSSPADTGSFKNTMMAATWPAWVPVILVYHSYRKALTK